METLLCQETGTVTTQAASGKRPKASADVNDNVLEPM
jgi:hypothetical protein